MVIAKKPGRDTLAYFWSAIVLSLLGLAAQLLIIPLALGQELQAVQILGLAALLCFIAAGVMAIIVMHQVISMLIYLVHHKH